MSGFAVVRVTIPLDQVLFSVRRISDISILARYNQPCEGVSFLQSFVFEVRSSDDSPMLKKERQRERLGDRRAAFRLLRRKRCDDDDQTAVRFPTPHIADGAKFRIAFIITTT
jgi:hypothetical protein